MSSLWSDCLSHLQSKVSPSDYSACLRPLKATVNKGELILYAQNPIVANWVKESFLGEIQDLARYLSQDPTLSVIVKDRFDVEEKPATVTARAPQEPEVSQIRTNLNSTLTFDNFVQGNSNQLAKAIAQQVANNPGRNTYNPFSLYGSTGLGKTHLLHAIGNEILKQNPSAKVLYIQAESFTRAMVSALQSNKMENFKKFYRSIDVLMVDDIQFFAKKEGSQEEFFHTFNSLLEQDKQIIVASDVFPKNIENIEERMRSRLSWGISAAIEPPELETRVAILMKKVENQAAEFLATYGFPLELREDAAFFLAQKMRTNVRELEGALNSVIATSGFTRRPITVDFVREALKDRFAAYDSLITIENIQRTVAEYYNIKVADLKSKSRSRSVARPRQMAMALAKELTTHSLPEIGREFGRDHTTVIHACKTINELCAEDSSIQEDYTNLTRKLSS